MKFGTNDISKIYLGTTEIEKAYLGSNVIYEKGGGADKNTLALFHFDEDFSNSYPGCTMNVQNYATISHYTGEPKFGDGFMLGDSNYVTTSGLNALGLTEFTFEFWWKCWSLPYGAFGGILTEPDLLTGHSVAMGTGDSTGYYSRKACLYKNANRISPENTVPIYGGEFNNVWWHHAMVYKNNTIKYYLNGQYVTSLSYTGPINVYEIYLNTGKVDVWPRYIDEFRFSDIARWDGEFTSPTEPYS